MRYTEEQIMREAETRVFKRLITETYPSGVVSVVSDTFDFWHAVTVIAPKLKDEILNRVPDSLGLAKTVFRPDSGDPVKIICGDPDAPEGAARKGAVEALWDIFGGTVNEKGYKTLNQRVGLIYGDSITPQRAEAILSQLALKGFASDNIVFGIGSFTFQYQTRDTLGFAMKATYVEINGESVEIFKDPKTDSGTKKSAKGLLQVLWDQEKSKFVLKDQVDKNAEEDVLNELSVVFLDGKIWANGEIETIRQTANGWVK